MQKIFLKNFSSDLEESSLFLKLQSWRDTRKTSYVIQLCYIFKIMLRGYIKSELVDSNDSVEVLGVDYEYRKIVNDI